MDRTRRLLAALLAALLLAALPANAAADDHDDDEAGRRKVDNVAEAVNQTDGSEIFRLAFAIDRIMSGDPTDPTNLAFAYSSCENCRTTAIAIQVVLSSTPPDQPVTPLNMAVAVNENCQSCETVALAYQIVLHSDEPIKLTGEGKQKVRDILERIAALEDEDLTPEELDARTSALVGELAQVLMEDTKPKNASSSKDDETESGDQDPDDSPPPGSTASPGSTVTPAPSTEPSSPAGSPSPTTEPSPSGTPNVGGSPQPSTTP